MPGGVRTTATQLLALTYADEHRAAEVLATLQRLRTGRLIEAQDMVSVTRAMDWGITLHYGADLRCDGLRAHQFWRTLTASLVLAPGGASSTVRPESFGLETEFVRGVEAELQLGSSAVFLLVPRSALGRVLPELRRFGGALLQTTIARAAVTRPRQSPHRALRPAHTDQEPLERQQL
jgi:uncharacterized membrane protein